MEDEALQEGVHLCMDIIHNTKEQVIAWGKYLPPERMRSLRLVLLKLDEARLWMGEVAR